MGSGFTSSITKKIAFIFLAVSLLQNKVVAQVTTDFVTTYKPAAASGTSNVNVTDVDYDGVSGNYFICGTYSNILKLTSTVIYTSAGGKDYFVAKYNTTGVLQWSASFGGTGDDEAIALDVLYSGNSIAIAGHLGSANVDFDPGAGSTLLSTQGGSDVFVQVLNGTGALVWAKSAGGTASETVSDVLFDQATGGNVLVAGTFSTIMDFFSNTNTLTNGGSDAYLCALNAVAGTYSWVRVLGGAGNDVAHRISVRGVSIDFAFDVAAASTTFSYNGSTTLSGTFSGTGYNGVVSTFAYNTGAFASYRQYTGNTTANRCVLLGSGTLVTVGTFASTMDVDPSAGTSNLTAIAGARDMYISAVDPSLYNFISSSTYHVKGIASGDVVAISNTIARSSSADITVVGNVTGPSGVDFGGTASADVIAAGGASHQSFIARFHSSANVFSLSFVYGNAKIAHGVDNSYASNIAYNPISTIATDFVVTGSYLAAYTPTTSCDFIPSSPLISVNPTFLNASMGYVQHFVGCATFTTTAVSNNYSICAGQTATLTASGATTYSWNTGSTATSFTVAPTTTTTYTVTGTKTGGCTTSVDTVKITVTSLPNVVGVSSKYSTCAGTTATLTASGGTTYSWNTGSTATSFTVAPTTTTTYSVTGTTAGCSKTDTVKITVTSLPNVVGVSNKYSTCAGTTATLTASGGTTYSWNTGSTATSFTVAPTTTTTYSVTGTTAGCAKTDTVKITVTQLPNVVASANNYSICNGNSATLTGSGGTTYSWNTGSTATSFTVAPTTTTTYTVTGTALGCSKTDTVKVNVNSITLSISPASASICSGSGASATFVASGGSTYVWSGGPSTATYSVTPSTTTTYTVTGTSTQGCTNTATAIVNVSTGAVIAVTPPAPTICSGSPALTLTASGANTYVWTSGPSTATYSVNPSTTTTYTVTGTAVGGCTGTTTVLVTTATKPTVTASASNITICLGSSSVLTAGGASTYLWSTGATSATISVSPTDGDTFGVIGTSTQGCTDTAFVSIVVNPIPDNSVSTNDPTLTAIETGATYQWFDCNLQQIISGANSQSYTAIANGNYGVLVTKNGCADTSTCYTIATVSIKSINRDELFVSVYPNPAHNQIIISNEVNTKMEIQLIDLVGKIVLKKEVTANEVKLDVSELPAGVYLMRLNSENKASIRKIIIE